MYTVLVTGGAGYVGSHVVLDLLKDGHDVVVVDNLVNSFQVANATKPESLLRVEKLAQRNVNFYQADIRNKDELNDVFNKHHFDCVGHFAALKAVGESCLQPLTYYQNNITGSSVLLEVMNVHNCHRLLYSSSATVYGTPQYLPLTEKHPTGLGCTNPYGKSKYFVEEILKDLCTSDDRWSVLSLRYFNPVGAHESGKIGEDPTGEPNNLMPYISQVAVGRRKCLTVFGTDYDTPDGTGVRDYIHVSDLSAGHLRAFNKLCDTKYSGFQALNLGTGRGYSVLEVLAAFSKACGFPVAHVMGPRRPGDVASSYADPSLAREQLKWEAEKNLQDMCDDTWKWQRLNPNGYKPA